MFSFNIYPQVLLVIASALGVIVYRVIIGLLLVDSSSVEQILFTSLASSLLNTFSIMIFGKVSLFYGLPCYLLMLLRAAHHENGDMPVLNILMFWSIKCTWLVMFFINSAGANVYTTLTNAGSPNLGVGRQWKGVAEANLRKRRTKSFQYGKGKST